MASKKPENMSYEATIEELDSLVNQLENGDLSLDDALKKFERGITLARAGQTKLNEAEQKVQILLNNSDDAPLTEFTDSSDNSPE
ncbi:exodeoxyribonuclease VII small subunit [Vibrio salinus]|uniref:exodeoxyribonuclease VII small subunit n=1 Tax=Vibrio salinus TaxID=2899784 RepID=UPI001E47FEFA|nr:exodeoxyribonuclease VII small subunit [Vibrio salinus]MCE0493057.1 exodeoxyribonuclease VII small subunit [Vibrio salinus]